MDAKKVPYFCWAFVHDFAQLRNTQEIADKRVDYTSLARLSGSGVRSLMLIVFYVDVHSFLTLVL